MYNTDLIPDKVLEILNMLPGLLLMKNTPQELVLVKMLLILLPPFPEVPYSSNSKVKSLKLLTDSKK